MAELRGHVASLALEKNKVSPASEDHVIRSSLHFGFTDPAGVCAVSRAVSDPASPLYGQFLTMDEFTARFAPSTAYVEEVAA